MVPALIHRRAAGVLLAAALAAMVVAPARAAGSASLHLASDSLTRWQYPFDTSIERTVTATNTGSAPGAWTFRSSSSTVDFIACMPQDGALYLAPGESKPIVCQSGFDADVPDSRNWHPGQVHSVDLYLDFFEGSQPVAPRQSVWRRLTLGNTVDVLPTEDTSQPVAPIGPCGQVFCGTPGSTQTNCTPGAPCTNPQCPGQVNCSQGGPPPSSSMAGANATITGSVIDASGAVIVHAKVAVINPEARWQTEADTDGSGAFTAKVVAHHRPFFNDWQTYLVSYGGVTSAVQPQPGQTISVPLSAKPPPTSLSYSMVADIDTKMPVDRLAVTKDGRYAVTAPFSDVVLPNPYLAANAHIDYFDVLNAKLLWQYPVEAMVPSVDISDDGRFVASPDPGTPGQSIANFAGLVLLDQRGSVVWKRKVCCPDGTVSEDGAQFTVRTQGVSVVKFSHDARYLAYGTNSGHLVVLDRATQAVRMSAFLGGGKVRDLAWSADGVRIYASSGDEDVYALDSASGGVLWRTSVGGWSLVWGVSRDYVAASPKVGQGIYLLRLSDGKLLWKYPTQATEQVLLISPDQSRVLTGNFFNGSPFTSVLDVSTGRPVWTSAIQINGAAQSQDGGLYLLDEFRGDGQDNVAGAHDQFDLYSSRGEPLWSYLEPAPAVPWSHGSESVAFISPDARRLMVGSAENGHVYFFKGSPPQPAKVPAATHHAPPPPAATRATPVAGVVAGVAAALVVLVIVAAVALRHLRAPR